MQSNHKTILELLCCCGFIKALGAGQSGSYMGDVTVLDELGGGGVNVLTSSIHSDSILQMKVVSLTSSFVGSGGRVLTHAGTVSTHSLLRLCCCVESLGGLFCSSNAPFVFILLFLECVCGGGLCTGDSDRLEAETVRERHRYGESGSDPGVSLLL